MQGIGKQLQNHSVALISLVIAITSLGYNTWRNEQTEANRNVRYAAFEVLLKLGELERTVFHAHYDLDRTQGNPRIGWAYVLTIRDLSRVMPEPVPEKAENLYSVWDAEWAGLGEDEVRTQNILEAIDQVRMSVLATLDSLR